MTLRSLRFQAAVLALFCMSNESLAFTTRVNSHSSGGQQHTVPFAPTTTIQHSSSTSALHAVHTAALSARSSSSTTTRPTDQEQRVFLQKAVERRRLQALHDEARGCSSTTLSTLQLARAAGYGNDLHAYEAALEEGHRAREALVTRNMGLVYYCVNEIVGKRGRSLQSLSREDLVQEGAIGLARAVDKWNPAIGGKFSTYAVYWVRAAILRGIAERDDLMRVPEHVSAAVSKVTKAAAQLGISMDSDNLLSSVYSSSKETSWKEAQAAKALAEQAGLTPAQVAQALKVRERRNKGMTSFETWMQKGRDLESDTGTLLSSSSSSSSAAESDANDESKEVLRQELSRFLRPREMEALSWRYGLVTTTATTGETKVATGSKKKQKKNYLARAEQELFGSTASANTAAAAGGRWGEAMSFNEVGKRMQVSAEYGRRLCHKALAKLQQAAEDGNLSPSMLAL